MPVLVPMDSTMAGYCASGFTGAPSCAPGRGRCAGQLREVPASSIDAQSLGGVAVLGLGSGSVQPGVNPSDEPAADPSDLLTMGAQERSR